MPPVHTPKPMGLSLYAQHAAKWGGCQLCALGATRNKICLARGQFPCDALFIGEGPGESEDTLGAPFMGPAGMLLDSLIARALNGRTDLRLGFGNLVCCVPREGSGAKAQEPLPEEIEACAPRLIELVALAQPRLIVCVGALARDYLDPKMRGHVKIPREIPRVAVLHPAAILKSNQSMKGLQQQRVVVALANAFGDLEQRRP